MTKGYGLLRYDQLTLEKDLFIAIVCCDLAIATHDKKNAQINQFGCELEDFGYPLFKTLAKNLWLTIKMKDLCIFLA